MSNVVPIRKVVQEPTPPKKEITYNAREVAGFSLASLGIGILAGFFIGCLFTALMLKVG